MYTRYKGHVIEMPTDRLGRRVIDGVGVCIRCGELISVYYTRYGLHIAVTSECSKQLDQQLDQEAQ